MVSNETLQKANAHTWRQPSHVCSWSYLNCGHMDLGSLGKDLDKNDLEIIMLISGRNHVSHILTMRRRYALSVSMCFYIHGHLLWTCFWCLSNIAFGLKDHDHFQWRSRKQPRPAKLSVSDWVPEVLFSKLWSKTASIYMAVWNKMQPPTFWCYSQELNIDTL